jgi:FkbM family methyltransferase
VGTTQLVVERSMTGATGNIYCGLHEFVDMAFVLHMLRSDDLFIDVGANVGSYTLLASGVVGARSISIEPVPATFEKFQRNIRINSISERVEAFHCVAGRESGAVWFSTDRDTMNHVVDVSYAGRKKSIEVRTLDSILAGKSPILWKVDVEGFELEVLGGARGALGCETLRAVLLEADDQRIGEIMMARGFKRFLYDPWARRIEPSARGQDGEKLRNHLWVRDVAFVEERCRNAPMVQVLGQSF